MSKLSARQEAFVREYAVSLNATDAAIKAGYSKKTAGVVAWEILQKPYIQAAVAERVGKHFAKVDLKAETIRAELLNIATFDVAECYDADGNLKPLHEMPEGIRKALSSVETNEIWGEDGAVGRVRKIRPFDKIRALELLGKYFQLFKDKIEVTGEVEIRLDLGTGIAKEA
jgi:phage terminase small subunit